MCAGALPISTASSEGQWRTQLTTCSTNVLDDVLGDVPDKRVRQHAQQSNATSDGYEGDGGHQRRHVCEQATLGCSLCTLPLREWDTTSCSTSSSSSSTVFSSSAGARGMSRSSGSSCDAVETEPSSSAGARGVSRRPDSSSDLTSL